MSDSNQNSNKVLAIYPGSFDPFHLGHKNVLEKAERIFGEGNVIIAVGVNPKKVNKAEGQYVPDYDRAATIKQNFPSKIVENYNSFLHEYITKKEEEGFDVILVRGLRNGHDLTHEVNQIRIMKDFKPDIKELFFHCDPIFSHISSSMINDLKMMPGGESMMLEYLPMPE